MTEPEPRGTGTGEQDSALEGKQRVRELVRRFAEQESAFMEVGYNETQARREFIDPLFAALGWDIDNTQGTPEPYKDVIHEDVVRIGGTSKAPDYGFRIAGVRQFFVEAKKPAVNVRDQISASFQLRRYAWSAKLPLSVLTDFQEFAVYDCRVRPDPADGAGTARVLYFTYDEYIDRWEEFWNLLSRPAVECGSIERFMGTLRSRRGRMEVDAAFLGEMESWRVLLAENLALRNEQLTTRQLNRVVQATIDRIVFLRICEDRGIEEHGQLRDLAKDPGLYARLCRLYQHADDRYNSGLFHFRAEKDREETPDEISLSLTIDDEPLRYVIDRLYFPQSPYEFAVLPADILGQVYEQFLGQVITLTDGHEALVEEKPEVRKAGGVYYTPSPIVEHIVHETLGPLVSESSPRRVTSLKIVDPACGSGSFLLGAYEFLLQWHRDWYAAHRPERHGRQLYRTPAGEWALTAAEKRRILVNNIFGVDIDAQAVEVTKLSLLLKVLEGESQETINRQLQLVHERALPDLGQNIRWGNSLVGTEVYGQRALEADPESEFRINPFDWRQAFPDVFQRGGFDAVIGNPPWLMAGYHVKDSLPYLNGHYTTATGKYDMYYLFIERATHLVREGGRIGLIVPNKFFHTRAARALRSLLGGDRWVRRVIDFRDEQVFRGATNYSCILSLKKGASDEPQYARSDAALSVGRVIDVPWSSLQSDEWFFLDRPTRELFERIRRATEPLDQLTDRFGTGVQSGADRILVSDEATAASNGIDPALLEPLLRGRDVRRYGPAEPSRLVVFPYQRDGDGFAILGPEELAEYPDTLAWLEAHRQKLARRVWFDKTAEELSGQWYGLMYLDAPSTFERPHILTPSLASAANFTLGHGALFVTGTAGVTSVVPKDTVEEDIRYLLGVLNSKLLSSYALAFSPIFSGGHFKWSAPYLRKLPIRRINFTAKTDVRHHDGIAALVERRMRQANPSDDPVAVERRRLALEREIDQHVYELYELSDEDVDVLLALDD